MAKRESCYNCVFSRIDPEVWRRCEYIGESLVPQCANHPSPRAAVRRHGDPLPELPAQAAARPQATSG